jgi:hypothetical protein
MLNLNNKSNPLNKRVRPKIIVDMKPSEFSKKLDKFTLWFFLPLFLSYFLIHLIIYFVR